MAKLLWGKVYFQDQFAGILNQLPGERYTFQYDEHYLDSKAPPIAHTLPLSENVFTNEQNIHPFFDNLVAEGWLEQAQCRLLGKRYCSRFELLLAFGHDCAGAVTIVDPEEIPLVEDAIDISDGRNLALLRSRASLSGIQPKLLLTNVDGTFRPIELNESSTHIAKLPSDSINDIVLNEWLTIQACKALLPKDEHLEVELAPLPNIAEKALIVKRFDRDESGSKLHFEEFNQLLNLQTHEKYDGTYQQMASFIYNTPICSPVEVFKLFKRVLVAILTGNTDMHFKNFAMFHTSQGLRLTPNYDQVAAAIYKPYQYMALEFDGAKDRILGQIKPKNIIALGHEFKLSNTSILMAVSDLEKRLDSAKDAVEKGGDTMEYMSDKIIQMMEKRWNGTFKYIGKLLLQKR